MLSSHQAFPQLDPRRGYCSEPENAFGSSGVCGAPREVLLGKTCKIRRGFTWSISTMALAEGTNISPAQVGGWCCCTGPACTLWFGCRCCWLPVFQTRYQSAKRFTLKHACICPLMQKSQIAKVLSMPSLKLKKPQKQDKKPILEMSSSAFPNPFEVDVGQSPSSGLMPQKSFLPHCPSAQDLWLWAGPSPYSCLRKKKLDCKRQ